MVRHLPPDWRALALRRRIDEVPEGVQGVAIDLTRAESLSCLEDLCPDALLVTLIPAQRTPEGYRRGFAEAMDNIVAGLGAHRPARAFFVSSTRVYAEKSGAWVDESSPLASADEYAGSIIEAEQILLDGVPGSVVLRAAGLYGHGPGPLLRAVTSGRLRPARPRVFGNRIHREDVAGFIAHALEHGVTDRVVNLCDDAAVALQDVEAWFCSQLRLPYAPFPGNAPGNAPRTPPGHKRISNARLHNTGYELQFPDYRSGYAQVLRQWMEHSEREDGLDLN